MIYVDRAVYKRPNGRVLYAHMTATTLRELHEFAASIGIKRCWFHSHHSHAHYDINSTQRDIAVNSGAVEVTSKQLLRLSQVCK